MKTKIPTETPKGALKKLNFQADPIRRGRESRTEVLANMRSSRWSGPDRRFAPTPKYMNINGIPHKVKDGQWVPLVKVS